MRINDPLLLSEMPEKEAKLFILRAYKRSLSLIRVGKVCAVIAFVCFGAGILFDVWLWASYSHNLSVWDLLVYIGVITLLAYPTTIFFMFPTRVLSAPLSKYLLPEGSVTEYYNKCVESIRSGIPSISPDTDDTRAIA